MNHTENLDAFLSGGALWGQSQQLQAVADEKRDAAIAVGQTVARKEYTLKNAAGEVVGDVWVGLAMTVVDNPTRVVNTGWDVPSDGKLVLPVGVIARVDLIGYQQDTRTSTNTIPEDWVLVSNS